ncbi:hypothetical protein ABBQ38_011477 [Trebouxia sp. C0009 RCD-2024]
MPYVEQHKYICWSGYQKYLDHDTVYCIMIYVVCVADQRTIYTSLLSADINGCHVVYADGVKVHPLRHTAHNLLHTLWHQNCSWVKEVSLHYSHKLLQFLLRDFALALGLAKFCCTMAQLMCSNTLRMLKRNARAILQWSQVISQPTEAIPVQPASRQT